MPPALVPERGSLTWDAGNRIAGNRIVGNRIVGNRIVGNRIVGNRRSNRRQKALGPCLLSRPLRLEFPGAVYHVTSCGDRREPIYRRDARGQTTTASCDRLNRVTRLAYADGTATASTYDQGATGIGRLTRYTLAGRDGCLDG